MFEILKMATIYSKDSKLNTPYSRLRFIRSLSGLSRKYIEEKYHLPEITLRKWETGTLSISKKGVQKCLKIYENENIFTTEAWIYNGIGPLPYLAIEFEYQDQDHLHKKIISYFKKIYQNCIVLQIKDETMLPIYQPNEIVIGDVHRGEIQKLHNKDCIVLLANDELILRKFVYYNDSSFSLVCTNSNATRQLDNTSIKVLAPVLWHKIKD